MVWPWHSIKLGDNCSPKKITATGQESQAPLSPSTLSLFVGYFSEPLPLAQHLQVSNKLYFTPNGKILLDFGFHAAKWAYSYS